MQNVDFLQQQITKQANKWTKVHLFGWHKQAICHLGKKGFSLLLN